MFLSYLNNKYLKNDLSGPEFSRYKLQVLVKCCQTHLSTFMVL